MDKLDDILQAYVAKGDDTQDKLLGAAFVVVNKDGVVYSGTAGRIGFDASSAAFGTDTFTWVASLTKIITSTSVMQLVEQGRIGLDDDVRSLVPELENAQILHGFENDKPILEKNTKPITLRILLSHTSGIGYDVLDQEIMRWSKAVGRTDYALSWSRQGFHTPLKFAPGDSWLYGPSTDWAGLVLEKITGKTLGAYMQEQIFDPLSMKDTGFWPEKLPQTAERHAGDVIRMNGKLVPGQPLPPKDHEIESGGAGLFTSAGDYAKFLQALLGTDLIREDTRKQLFTPQLNEKQRKVMETAAYVDIDPSANGFAPEFPSGLPINWGLGGVINTVDVEGKRRKGSMMWSGMANSRWWVDPETGIGAVLVAKVLPFGDPVVGSLYDELERALYKEL